MVIRKEPPHPPGCGLAGSPLTPHTVAPRDARVALRSPALGAAPLPLGLEGSGVTSGRQRGPQTELKIRRLERGSIGKNHPGHDREWGEPFQTRAVPSAPRCFLLSRMC